MSSESPAFPHRAARLGGAWTFGALFALESFARAINSTVVTLQAYDLLGSSQKVSLLMTVAGGAVLATSLAVPLLLARIPRRWGYTLGAVILALGSLAFMVDIVWAQVLGIYCRSVGASLLNITLALYIMDHVRRHDLAHVESARFSLSTIPWCAGPTFGVMLYTGFGPVAPQLLALATSACLIALFWYLRLREQGILRPAVSAPPNPLRNIGRFVSQPRLRLAWLIAFGRSCFWMTFFVYGPLMLLEGGLGKTAGGWLVSLSQLLLITAFLFGRLARRTGIRLVVTLAHAGTGVGAVAAGLLGTGAPIWAAALLLVASLCAVALDGVGGVTFLRAVKARERAEMAAVYRSYLDLSDLLPSLVFAVVLSLFPIGSVFVIMGALQFVIAAVTWRYLPRSMT